jgi:hypothetical protein
MEPVALRRAGREMHCWSAQPSRPICRTIAGAPDRQGLGPARGAGGEQRAEPDAFAATQGISQSYATRLVRLAWLAPDIVEAILAGRQPKGVTASALMRDTRLPTDWLDQREALGFICTKLPRSRSLRSATLRRTRPMRS